jgi:hypothetical protein
MQMKMLYAAVQSGSHPLGAEALQELAERRVPVKDLERLVHRIGQERIAERDAQAESFARRPLMDKYNCPLSVTPNVVSVSLDGGRQQLRSDALRPDDRTAHARAAIAPPGEPMAGATVADESARACAREAGASVETAPIAGENGSLEENLESAEGNWKNYNAGVLQTLSSVESAVDPCPEIPECFLDRPQIVQIAKEIHGTHTPDGGRPFERPDQEHPDLESPDLESPGLEFSESDSAAPAAHAADTENHSQRRRRPGAPEVLVQSVVASRQGSANFAVLLAAAAWVRGFFGAARRAFLGDGLRSNWTVWKRFFPTFTPILDFIHGLTHIYSAAAAGQSARAGWDRYEQAIRLAWCGQIDALLELMETWCQEAGPPQEDDPELHPRRVLKEELGYVRNNRERMKYAEYRRLGLPITTAHMESMVKQINYRVKGTEKFWSEPGAEAILQLRADFLSDTRPLHAFLRQRQLQATGQRPYHRSKT